MATHSSILAWKTPWMEDPGGLQSMGSQRVRYDLATNTSFIQYTAGKEITCSVGDLGSIPRLGRSSGEGNSYPLQYYCLRNPMDRGA